MIGRKTSLSWMLSFCLACQAGWPVMALAEATPQPILNHPDIEVSLPLLKAAQQLRDSGALFHLRTQKFAKLQKTRRAANAVGRFGSEIIQLQALLIVVGAMAVSAQHDRSELLKSGVAQPATSTMPTSSNADPNAATQTCGSQNLTVLSSVLCSGDLYMGIVGAIPGVVGTKVARILLGLTKLGLGRSGLATFISAMVSQATLISTSTAASFLWQEGIKNLTDAEQIHQAEGIAGRAIVAFSQGRFKQFQASSDGPLFSTILANMYKIARSDDQLRAQWLYNTWRFGMARGEFLAAIGSIMAASAASEMVSAISVTAGTAILGTTTGVGGAAVSLTSPVIGFIVGGAIGIGALTLMFQAALPQTFTRALQNSRAFLDSGSLRRQRNTINILAFGFSVARYPQASDLTYVQTYKQLLDSSLNLENSARSGLTNIAVEKFYELGLEQSRMLGQIATAEAAIRNPQLTQNVYLDIDGQILSFAQAQAKLCTSWFQRCEIDKATQLQKLDQLKPQVKAADATLGEIAQSAVDLYAQDETWLLGLLRDTRFVFAPPIAETLAQARQRAALLRDNLKIVFGSYSPNLSSYFGLNVQDGDADFSRQELSIYYTQSYVEADIVQGIEKAIGL